MADYKNEFGIFADRPPVEKKFYDRNKVVAGLVIFFAIVTLPFWENVGKVIPSPTPKLDTPAIQKLAAKERKCVMPTDWMRANHMQLLVDWRESVVREATRDWKAPDGRKFLASLSNTCMDCHSNKTQFCDQCHNFVAVTPTCWGCHLDKEAKVAARVEAK